MEFGEPTQSRRLLILFALPKSGSQALGAAFDAGFVRETSGRHAPWTKEVPNGLHVDMPLTGKHLRKYDKSGWIPHAPCTFVTLDTVADIRANAFGRSWTDHWSWTRSCSGS